MCISNTRHTLVEQNYDKMKLGIKLLYQWGTFIESLLQCCDRSRGQNKNLHTDMTSMPTHPQKGQTPNKQSGGH